MENSILYKAVKGLCKWAIGSAGWIVGIWAAYFAWITAVSQVLRIFER